MIACSSVHLCGFHTWKKVTALNVHETLNESTSIQSHDRRYMDEILPIRRKTLSNQSIEIMRSTI